MTKKTPNAQRRTPNIEVRSWRIAELPDGEYNSKSRVEISCTNCAFVSKNCGRQNAGCDS